MAIGSNHDRLMSDINVTPFVDVMLVLLIIFMVTAPLMTQGVDVSLPEASTEALPTVSDQLIITMNKDRQVFINDFQVEIAYLREKLRKILENREDRAVYLKADKDIPYGDVVRVMAEIKEAGVDKLGMVTLPPEKTDQKTDKETETPAPAS